MEKLNAELNDIWHQLSLSLGLTSPTPGEKLHYGSHSGSIVDRLLKSVGVRDR